MQPTNSEPGNVARGDQNVHHALVDVRHVHVRFGTQTILRDICLQIPRGQTLAIIGESGCGKTVLMETMIGLIPPVGGQVFFDGHELARLNDRELTRQADAFRFCIPASSVV